MFNALAKEGYGAEANHEKAVSIWK